MMQFFKHKAKSSDRVGLAISANHLAFARLEMRKGKPHLLASKNYPITSEKDIPRILDRGVRELELEGKQCSFVLSQDDYTLHLVEAPDVEANEMRQAVRWKIKDLLNMKVDEAAIDVFPVPEDAYRGREMVYVVATRRDRVKTLVDMITKSGMELAVIDVPELVMHNLARAFIDDTSGVAFMDLRGAGSTMNISFEGDLYLTRRINTQLDPDVMQSPEWDSLKDRLILEIQRSMDYYESQMAKGELSRIVIAERQQDTADMVESLDSALSAKVTALDLSEHLDSDVELTTSMQQIGMAAIGATLRGYSKPEQPDASPEPLELGTPQEAA